MNYLVHLYLAGTDPELQLGGLMGDFVKGPIPADCPAGLASGLFLHRRIDSLAQNSRHTRQSRQRLPPKFGHGRGIIVDIFYDHFLAANWAEYSSTPLADYAAGIYRLLHENHARLPSALQQVARNMSEHNWLVSYQHREVVGRVLLRISQRLSRPLPLQEAIADLNRHEALFHQDFSGFMREASDFAKHQRQTLH